MTRSRPFVIWTMRRTGGTSLTMLLSRLSEHPTREHEPFNHGRRFGWVAENFKTHADPARLRADMETALAERPNIKHCYDLLPMALHAALLEVTQKLDYAHMILDRRDEGSRIRSLELALATGAWGPDDARKVYPAYLEGDTPVPEMALDRIARMRKTAASRRKWLAGALGSAGISPVVVFFEDVYGPGAEGAARIDATVKALGLDRDRLPDFDAQVARSLEGSGQGSGRILPLVPNIAEVEKALAAPKGWPNPFDGGHEKATESPAEDPAADTPPPARR